MNMLPTYEVRADVFDKILYDYSARTEYTKNIFAYSFGYSNKNTIYYDSEYLICREYILNYYTNCIDNCTSWKQVRLRRVIDADTAVMPTITGSYAWNFIFKILRKYYSDEEIEEIFLSHEEEKDPDYKQYHYTAPVEKYSLYKYNNCYKYDINGAHCAAVITLFPRAKKEFMKMYEKRREKPVFKQLFNFFVGEMCRKAHRKTYNWIVHRTTKKLYDAIDTTGGLIIYANTDGFIVQSPNNKLATSPNLFDFKLEYSGDVYVYASKNYILYQCGEEMRGSCRQEVRAEIDLRRGIVVDYDVKRTSLGYDANNVQRFHSEVINKVKREVKCYEQKD